MKQWLSEADCKLETVFIDEHAAGVLMSPRIMLITILTATLTDLNVIKTHFFFFCKVV